MGLFPSFTPTYHQESYPAISPTRPELSTKGKTVAVSGGGAGIGAGISRAFAESGSTQIAILGRREATLRSHADKIEKEFPGVKVLCCVADVANAEQVDKAFADIKAAFGTLDIFVNNAGLGAGPDPPTVADSDVDYWWNIAEMNLKGAYLSSRAFLRQSPEDGTLINVTTGIAHVPAMFPGSSAYGAGKAGALKMFEYIAAENPNKGVYSVHPGMVATEMNAKSGYPAMDDGEPIL